MASKKKQGKSPTIMHDHAIQASTTWIHRIDPDFHKKSVIRLRDSLLRMEEIEEASEASRDEVINAAANLVTGSIPYAHHHLETRFYRNGHPSPDRPVTSATTREPRLTEAIETLLWAIWTLNTPEKA